MIHCLNHCVEGVSIAFAREVKDIRCCSAVIKTCECAQQCDRHKHDAVSDSPLCGNHRKQRKNTEQVKRNEEGEKLRAGIDIDHKMRNADQQRQQAEQPPASQLFRIITPDMMQNCKNQHDKKNSDAP